jgi:hypothetical protein
MVSSLLCGFQCNPCPNKSGKRFVRFPDVLPFGWNCRYFAFFFAAFFAGAFLAGAFLVAILPILPFDDLASMLQHLVQLKNV